MVGRLGHHASVRAEGPGWPASDGQLVELQHRLARDAASVLARDPWTPPADPVVGGCFVAFARGQAGPGQPGDRAWAGAVAWRPASAPPGGGRPVDRHLRGAAGDGSPRRADDVIAQSVVSRRVAAGYVPGLLALREGPVLADAVAGLAVRPDVLLVDATGLDHPRGAGLAVHLGAVAGLPTVGVTQRPLVAAGDPPGPRRGGAAPLRLDGRCVGYLVCTRTGSRPVVAHAGWRTTPETAARTVLTASTPSARTPVPLQEARRVAREARAIAERR